MNTKYWLKVEQTMRMLEGKYPEAFFPKDSPDTKPLRIGIFTLLTGDNPDVSRKVISDVLKIYTMKTRYLRALAFCANRVSLDGTPFEAVSESHRNHAIAALLERQRVLLGKEAA